jgi:hypothetical protein
MATTRDPNPNIEVFALGHFEQMQIDLALTLTAEYIENGVQDRDAIDLLVTHLDLDALRGLMRIFRSHGTVQVIRTNEED